MATFKERLEKKRQAASPAPEAWVPRVGDRVRVKDGSLLHSGRQGVVSLFVIDDAWAVDFGDGTPHCAMRVREIEPAPATAMPEGKAGKEELSPELSAAVDRLAAISDRKQQKLTCSKCRALYLHEGGYASAELCGYCAVNSHESLLMAVDTKPAVRYWNEKPRPRPRSRFDGGPWQEWPKGDERNEP